MCSFKANLNTIILNELSKWSHAHITHKYIRTVHVHTEIERVNEKSESEKNKYRHRDSTAAYLYGFACMVVAIHRTAIIASAIFKVNNK